MIRKNISYREAIVLKGNKPNPTNSLQKMLEEALRHPPITRKQEMEKESTQVRLIFSHQGYSNLLCCQLIQFDEGASQPIVKLDSKTQEYVIDAIRPEEGSAKQASNSAEFINSILYFVVKDNHVVFIAGRSLRSKELENHLNWLLKDCTNALSASEDLILNKRAPKEIEEILKENHVKEVSLEAGIKAEQLDLPFETSHRESDLHQSMWEKFQNIVKKDFLSKNNSAGLSQAIENANLRMGLKLLVEKEASKSWRKFLDETAISFRHFNFEETVIILDNGNVIKGNELDLTSQISVEIGPNGLPKLQELWKEMISWLTSLTRQEGLGDV
ncbi:hypothetical protein [uncultured Turicimonas sp.]|uniref:hypothetical protein n=1 Tax=uncultured Turicimonas sp. TaxID=1918607 RepID=UPI00280560B5|nr:hypothetical protein [uncultured Turicimonas sp.]